MNPDTESDLHLELAYWQEIHAELGPMSDDIGTLSDLSAKIMINVATVAATATPAQWPSLTTAAEQAGATMNTLLSLQRRLQAVLDLAGGRITILAARAEGLRHAG